MEFLRQLLAGINKAWRNLSASARVNLGVAALATVVLVGAVVVVGSRPQYVNLYTGLKLEDASNIEAYLSEQKIPYQTLDGGQTVQIPIKNRNDVRVALAGRNLPKFHSGAVGLELFDRQDIMTNQYLQNVNYMRAIQGELQRMLNEFDWVDSSMVFIRESKEELFASEQKPSEAAITLQVNRMPTREEVKGVLAIVGSFGGANLDRDHITVTTTDRGPVYLPPEDGVTALVSNKHDMVHEFEREAERSAEKALGDIGVRAVVRVSADIDFTRKTETKTKQLEGVVVSSQTTNDSTTTTDAVPQGEAGARANMPEGVTVPGGTKTEQTTKNTIENMMPTVETTETSVEPGTIVTGYKVAAIVEGRYQDEKDTAGKPTGKKTYMPRTDDELEVYRDIIAADVGVSMKPEDVSIHDHPFEIEQLAEVTTAMREVEAASTRTLVLKYGMNVLKLVLVLAGFLLVRRMVTRAFTGVPERVEEVAPVPQATAEDMRRREIATEVERASRQQPDQVAAVLRSWLGEEE